MRTIYLLSTALVLLLSTGFAQQKQILAQTKVKFDEKPRVNERSVNSLSFNKIMTDWVRVDTMQNSLSPASPLLNPIAYDHFSEALIFVHRGSDDYAQSSGEIWYNLSTDHGENWNRISAINETLDLSARYPSCAISNPTEGGVSQAKGVFTWTHINFPVFYGTGYGYDEPLGGGLPQVNYDSAYLSVPVVWTVDEWTFWAGSTNEGYFVARTK